MTNLRNVPRILRHLRTSSLNSRQEVASPIATWKSTLIFSMGTSTSKQVPTSFPLFNRLPYEIRSQIWEESFRPEVHFLHPHRRRSPLKSIPYDSTSTSTVPAKPHGTSTAPSQSAPDEPQSSPPQLDMIWPDTSQGSHILTIQRNSLA